MKNILLLQAKHNKIADKTMFDVFKEMEKNGKKDELYKECGLYYKSIIYTLDHALSGSIRLFVKQLSLCADKKIDVEKLVNLVQSDLKLSDSLLHDLDALYKVQDEVNDKIIEIIENISDFNKIQKLELRTRSVEKPLSQLILALLNHPIHHRGQIAGILDTLGISNDFSLMLNM